MLLTRSSLSFVLCTLACSSVAVAACVGDDPANARGPGADAGGGSSSGQGGTSSTSSGGSTSSGSSGSTDAGDEPDAAVLPAGSVDPTYASGFHPFAITDAAFQLRGVSIDALGGVVVVGAAVDTGTCLHGAVGVMRLTPDGAPLTVFGGVGATCWRSGGLVEGLAVAALPTGDIVAVGARADESYTGPDPSERGAGFLTFVRLRTDASVVAALDVDSPAGYALGSHYRARAIAVTDTEVTIAGTVRDPLQAASSSKGFVARYSYETASYQKRWGILDPAVRGFAGVGFAADGNTMVGGAQPSNLGAPLDRLFVRTYSATGTAGPDLVSQYERPVNVASAASTLLDAPGTPVVLASTNVDPATGIGTGAVLTRFAQGIVDPTFGSNGVARITGLRFDAERSSNVATRDAEGRIVLLVPGTDGTPIVHRLTAAGVPDASFGTAGKVRLELPLAPGGGDGSTPTYDHDLGADGFVVTDAQSRITVVFPGKDGFFAQRLTP